MITSGNVQKCRHPQCDVMVMMCRYNKPPHKLAPIEVQPSDDGNILVTGTSYEIVPKDQRERVRTGGFVLRKSHFATCPFASTFGKKKPAKALPANVLRFPR